MRRIWKLLPLVGLLAACNLPVRTPDTPIPPPASPTPDMPIDQPIQDARHLLEGVCFEYLVEQANRLFVIETPFQLIQFYNEVDESERCRLPVARHAFDFETGHILVGAVNVGTGCQAITDLLGLVRDDKERRIIVRVAWGVSGDCNYRLVRPFWVSLPRPPEGYTVALAFVPVSAGTPGLTPGP